MLTGGEMNTIPQRNREHWHYERITTTRPAWHEGLAGQWRVGERRLRALFIGEECTIGQYRVLRDEATLYYVFSGHTPEGNFNSIRAVLTFVIYGQRASARQQSSPFRGVYRSRSKTRFYAQICVDMRQYHLGSFDTDTEAARAYDAFVLAHGLDRPLNFPQERAA